MVSGQRHWRLVVAGLSIAFGLLVLAGPRRDTAVLVLVAGIYGVVAGPCAWWQPAARRLPPR